MIKIPNGNAITTASLNETIKYTLNWHNYQFKAVVTTAAHGTHTTTYDYSFIESAGSNSVTELVFKAGNYCQDSDLNVNDGCRVGFNVVDVQHT
jgi:hypothetical protein